MKRYVKELYKDLKEQLLVIGAERHQEYLEVALEMDKILSMAERGLLTNKEAASALITSFDKAYYGLY